MRCCDCKQDLPVELFAKNRRTKTGYNCICKPCKKARDSKHYAENGEKIREHNRKYNQDNREWFYIYCREWNASNRSSIIEANHVLRAKQYYAGPYDRINPKTLYERDKGICGICSSPVQEGMGEDSIDHVIPLSKGGLHIWSNVQLAHLQCNRIKGDR